MSVITVQTLTTVGLVTSYTAAASAGDEVKNNGHIFLHWKNAEAVDNVITIASQFSPVPKGLATIDISITVTALGEKMAGFFDKTAYNDSSAYLQMTYTTHTGLTVAAISVT